MLLTYMVWLTPFRKSAETLTDALFEKLKDKLSFERLVKGPINYFKVSREDHAKQLLI